MDKNFDEDLLSLDELDQVTGGTLKEISYDLKFLSDIGFDIQPCSKDYIYNYFSEVGNALCSTWEKAGVLCISINDSDYKKNIYTDKNGKKISRKTAMEMAMKFKGVNVDPADYGAP